MRRTILFVAAGLLLNFASKATAGGGMGKSPEEVQSLPKAGTFSGRVLTEKGTPISGAVVTLPGLAGSTLGKTKTSADGTFSLTVEDLDTRPIHRFHQGLEIWAEDFGFGFVPGRRITLFPGRDKPLGDIIVEPGRTYTGRVVDHQGRPIRGASVQCGTYGRSGLNSEDVKATTDANGRFQTPLLPAGSHYARVEAPGYLSLLVLGETFQSAASEGALPDLILKPDDPVTGVVKNEKGEPVPDVPVRSNAFTTKTDLEGKFVLRGFSQKAMFQMQIQVDGYVPIDWGVRRTSKGFEHFEVKQTPPLPFMDKSMTWPRYKQALEEITVTSPKLEVRLEPVATIRGRAVDAETGRPVQVTRILRCFCAEEEWRGGSQRLPKFLVHTTQAGKFLADLLLSHGISPDRLGRWLRRCRGLYAQSLDA